MTTLTGYVMTLANSIIGVSLLAMPYCFKQCGVILAILLLLTSGIVTRLACHFLVKSAVMCRRSSFQLLAYHAFGRSGKLLIEIGVIGFLLGTCVAFFVVIGDLAPAIAARLLNLDNNTTLRTVVLVASSLVLVLPLSLLRNIESLAAISTGTMLFYFLLTIKLLTESFPHLAAADWTSAVNYWRPEGVLQCFPIFAMALSCQTQIFEILEVLPGANLERMNGVVRSAVGLCSCFYIAVGFFGYVAYAREPIGGNVLLSFSSSLSSDIFQLGFVASVALSFPLVVFPCRASLNSLLSKKVPQYHDSTTQATYIGDGRFKLLTLGIVSSSLLIGLFIPNIEFVLGFVGSTIGVATCIIFPASAFVNISNKDTSERLIAKITLVLGIIVMILGTFVNIETVTDRQVVLPSDPIVRAQNIMGVPVELPPRLDVPPLGAQLASSNDIAQDSKIKINAPEIAVKPQIEESVKRVEPPVPVEPAANSLQKSGNDEIKQKQLDNHDDSRRDKYTDEKKMDETPIKSGTFQEHDILPKLDVKFTEKAPEVMMPKEIPVVSNNEKLNKSIDNQVSISKAVDKAKAETINEDALAKEDKELQESDVLKKEEEKKQVELLNKLKEHQEEQKKLLQEQQHILEEIKIRDEIKDHQKEQKELLQEQQNILDEIKIRGKLSAEGVNAGNDDHNNKMREVIDDLKERKQALDKTKDVKIAEDKKRVAGKKVIEKIVKPIEEKQPAVNIDLGAVIKKEKLPLPLLKQIKAPSAGRDILEEKNIREKRDIPEESCDKHSQVEIDPPKSEASNDLNYVKNDMSGIKESEVLSPPKNHDAKLISGDQEVNLVNDIVKRDTVVVK